MDRSRNTDDAENVTVNLLKYEKVIYLGGGD